MTREAILVGGPRNGRVIPTGSATPPVLTFPYPADQAPVFPGDPTPQPLVRPEHYRYESTDENGRHRYVYAEEWS